MSDFIPTMESESANIQSQPYNQPAEEAVLGAVLINPDAYVRIGSRSSNRNIFTSSAMAGSGRPTAI